MSEMSYRKSGVNIDEGNRFVELIKNMVEGTHNKSVLGGLGGFAGFYNISDIKMSEPVLVSCTDGVGTKLKVAIDAGRYDTVGIDLVAMSVNDLIVTGAVPLFFLDYIATGRLSPEAMADVVKGIVDGCKQSGSALLGGETAEMPGMYKDGDFDLGGFAVGMVNKPDIIDGSAVKSGDVLVGLASSGFHSNGYSLLRKVFFEDNGLKPEDTVASYGTVADLLLEPTRIYVKTVRKVLEAKLPIHGMVHITGGGFYDNIPRVLPEGVDVIIDKDAFPEVKAISAFRSVSDIEERELYRVFNMGVGYVFVLPSNYADELIRIAESCGEIARVIGHTVNGSKSVRIKGIDL